MTNSEFIEMLYKEPEYFDLVKITILTHPGINEHKFDEYVSDVFYAALRAQDLQSHPNIKGWLVKTTRNVIRNAVQKSNREKFNSPISKREINGVKSGFDFIADLEDKERVQEIINMLSRVLTESEYSLFEYKVLEKLTNQEIAAKLGIKLTSVEVKVTRLRNKIRKNL